MPGGGDLHIGSYSPLTGFVFIFNLIVGAGALTIPHAFAQVGLLYGSMALAVLAFTSYMTATFMVESIAGANALKKRTRGPSSKVTEPLSGVDREVEEMLEDESRAEFMPLMVEQDKLEKNLRMKNPNQELDFNLSNKMELAQMAHMLFSRRGNIAFYACTIVYLYGDLAIYAVAVPKSLREIVCPRPQAGIDVWRCNEQMNSSELYKSFVLLFGCLLSPFAFGHVQKTRTLQFVTTAIRHLSFGLMVLLALIGIIHGQGRSISDVVADEKPGNIPIFFGVCIYSFMCHHSIPGLVAPISNKSKVGVVLASAFVAVLGVYFVLCSSATFRFHPEEIDDVYTLNFSDYPIHFVAYFLSLFPVFTLSANFPLIAITLRENLKTLIHNIHTDDEEDQTHSNEPETTGVVAFLTRHAYALVAILPPLIVAFFTEDVSMLVGFTGAYAGLGIQWIVPACLVLSLRRRLQRKEFTKHTTSVALGSAHSKKNPFASPFSHNGWVYLTFALSIVSIVIITVSHGLV